MLACSGEIIMWDLKKSGKEKWSLLGSSSDGQNHSRIVFNMISFHSGGRELLLSTSMDREVRPPIICTYKQFSPKCSNLLYQVLYCVPPQYFLGSNMLLKYVRRKFVMQCVYIYIYTQWVRKVFRPPYIFHSLLYCSHC